MDWKSKAQRIANPDQRKVHSRCKESIRQMLKNQRNRKVRRYNKLEKPLIKYKGYEL